MAKVYDTKTQAEVEVPSADATAGLRAGRYMPVGRVLIARDDGEMGTIDPTELGRALDSGFRIVDDDEAVSIRDKREAESLGSMAKGVAEAATSGTTLGLSTLIASQYNDPEAMARRREAIGTLGDVAEIGGAIAPIVASGGSSTAVQASGRGLAATLARASPTAVLSRGAARFERGLASMIGEGGGVTKLVPKAAGGFVEAAGQGAGASIDEQVLGNQELAADKIVSDGLMAGAFGSVAPIAVHGLAKVMSGAARAPIEGMRTILGRGNAASGGTATREAAELMAQGVDAPLSVPARAWKATAVANGTPDDVAHRLAVLADAESATGDIGRVAREMPRIEREAGELVADRVPKIHADMQGQARRLAGGESKARYWDRLGPKRVEARRVAEAETDNLFAQHRGEIEALAAQNQRAADKFRGGVPYNAAMLHQQDDALAAFERELMDARNLSGREVSANVAMAADRYKRALGQIIDDNGGWGAASHVDPDVRITNVELRKRYQEVRSHLERTDLWGDAATAQADINAAYSRMADLDAAYKDATSGTGLGSVIDPDGTINAFKAIKLVRAHGRTGGDVAVSRLMDAMDARVAYFEKVSKYVDMDDAGRKALQSVKSNVEDLRKEFKRQAKDAAIADDLRTMRRAVGNDSPSHQMLTTAGPILGGAIGSMFGPAGTVAGLALGIVTDPHRSLLAYATVQQILKKADVRLDKVVGKMFSKSTSTAAKAPRKLPQLPVAAAAGAATRARDERQQKREQAIAKAADYMTSSEAVAQALSVPLYDLHQQAPVIASAIQDRVQRAASFLQSKAPKVYKRGKTKLVDPVSAASFERYLEAVTDPIGALERFDSGRITMETAEAIQHVYPQLFAEIQQRITDEMAVAEAEGREIPYDKRIRYGQLFQTTTDPSLTIAAATEMQMAIGADYDEPDAATVMAQGKTEKPGKIDPGRAEAMTTAGDRAANWRSTS